MTFLRPENAQRVLDACGAQNIESSQQIQRLWSDYGQILKVQLEGSSAKSVIVKEVHLQHDTAHPRGWNTDHSHQRKVKSYLVENHFYRHDSSQTLSNKCRVPAFIHEESSENGYLLILEDLDAAGWPLRKSSLNNMELEHCITWLAEFHATYMGHEAQGLWENGTYWHLDTRPDEWRALENRALKKAAHAIDERLKQAQHQTLVHGDAKIANFCFAEDGPVAALDFQYIGKGCGMKDLCYFLGSCLSESECEQREQELLDLYFQRLREALIPKASGATITAIEKEWRELYPYAWTDFHRFIEGWMPGHWKINRYSKALCQKVLKELKA